MTVHLPNGTTVRLEERDGNTLVILDSPNAPDYMRNIEAGRVIEGGFQPPFINPGFALSPEVLRTIADLIDEPLTTTVGEAPWVPLSVRRQVVEAISQAKSEGTTLEWARGLAAIEAMGSWLSGQLRLLENSVAEPLTNSDRLEDSRA